MPRSVVVGLTVVALLVAGGIRLRASPRVKPPPPDVVVVTIDTLRPDAAGDATTPALRAFLGSARRFAGARTVTPLTLPAHATLFSGLLPAGHGIHDNVAALGAARGFPVLAEEFRGAGYETAAFVAASVLGPHAGLAAGFDHYADATAAPPPYRPAPAQADAACAWLRQRSRARPAFVWVHFFDPHFPYLAYPGDATRPPTRDDDHPAVRYRGEVRRVDAALERLLAAIDPRAVVVLASDHGESLGAHGEATHGPLCYASTIDAVLAVRGPGFAPGTVDEAPRSLADVAPTLRALAGLRGQPGDGRSLLGPAAGVVVSESLQVWRIHGWGQCFAAFDGRFTLVESGPAVELFDRATDPAEETPLAPEGHEAYERLDRALAAYRSRSIDGFADFQPDAATAYGSGRRRAGAYLSRPDNAARVDPRTRIASWEALEQLRYEARFAVARGDATALLDVIDRIRKQTADDPPNPAPWWLLAQAQSDMARVARNRTWHTDAAASALEAVTRGYVGSVVVKQLVEDSLASPDDAALGRAFRTVATMDTVLDEGAIRAVRRAARVLVRLGDTEAAEIERTLLARAAAASRH